MERFKTFVFAILAGAAIAIGGAAFLSVESKILGSVLFTVGLFTVCSFGLNLYTGKVCYVFENKLSYTLDVIIIWLGNLVGTWATAQLYLMTRIGEGMAAKAMALCDVKLGDGLHPRHLLQRDDFHRRGRFQAHSPRGGQVSGPFLRCCGLHHLRL